MSVGTALTIVRTEDLSAGTRASIIEVCVAAFRSGSFEQMFDHIPAGGRHVLLQRDDQVVGHAVVTTRWLQPDGSPALPTAYVDAVATLPRYQRQGYGRMVMQHLASHIEDCAIGALKTASPGFYARLGWELWRGPLAGRRAGDVVPTPEQRGVMILRLPQTPALDLDGALSIECQPGRIW